MIKPIILSCLLCATLLQAEHNQSKDEIFRDKYLKNKPSGISGFKFDKNMDKNIDAKKFADINASKELDDFTYNTKDQSKAKQIANSINSNIRSQDYQREVKKYEDYILEDKGMGLKKYTGQYSKHLDNPSEQAAMYKNQYLESDERLIIAISSSVPKQTILNYFESLSNVNQDVMFILRGFVGNNPKFIMPTINYIQDLLVKDIEKEEAYEFRVDVNPKIFEKYNLQNVPAVIFVKNYDPYDEISGNTFIPNKENQEEAFVAYGDIGIEGVLRKINKKAKSKGLEKLIENLNKGFFDEN